MILSTIVLLEIALILSLLLLLLLEIKSVSVVSFNLESVGLECTMLSMFSFGDASGGVFVFSGMFVN